MLNAFFEAMDKTELEAIKADLGVNSRRLNQLYNDNRGHPAADHLYEATQKADAAYEAMKIVVAIMEEQS